MPISNLIKLFLQSCRRKELSHHTLTAYERDLKKFEKYLEHQEITIDHVSPQEINNWVDHLHLSGLAPASRKRHLACLRVFYTWLEDEKIVSHSPFQNVKINIKLPKRLPRNIPTNNLRQIFNEFTNKENPLTLENLSFHLAMEILLATGLRVGELCSIQMRDIDLQAGSIRVYGKGARERTVFITDQEVIRLIEIYLKKRTKAYPQNNTFLLARNGQEMTPDHLRWKIRKLTKKIGLNQHLTPHMFRHSAATLLLENGVDIRFVQRLLGHASLATTEIYTHVTENSLKAALKAGNFRNQIIS